MVVNALTPAVTTSATRSKPYLTRRTAKRLMLKGDLVRLRPAANERKDYHKGRSRAATKNPSPLSRSGRVRTKRPWAKDVAQAGRGTGWKEDWL